MSFIEVKNVSKIYTAGNEILKAVDNAELNIEKGEIVTVLGPSGSGKSTLINMIGGIDTPDNGAIIIDNLDITALKPSKLTHYRRDSVGFVFQFYNLISNLNVYENVEVVADICKDHLNIDEVLENLGISHLKKRYPIELSGGQQQRVAFARAIIKRLKILLCDEPTGALDYKSSIEILKLIKHINEQYKTTILIITHNNSISEIGNRTIRISSGKITHNDINEKIKPVEEISW